MQPTELFELSQSDPIRFIEEAFAMRPETGGALVPLRLWDVQRRFLSDLARWRKDGPVWVVCVKARRLGITSATQAWGFAHIASIRNYAMALLAQLKVPGRNIMDYPEFFWTRMQERLGEMFACGPDCSHNLSCAFREKTKDAWQFRWGSRIQVFTAETKTMARGSGFQFLHLSEAAYYGSKEEELISAILPTVPKDPTSNRTFVVAESTGAGNSGWFYETYQLAKEAEQARKEGRWAHDPWRPIFYPWFLDRRYRRPDLLIDGKLPPDPVYDEEEEMLRKRFGLDDAQLAWRRVTIETEFNRDVALFRREYPCDDREAFLAKGADLFPQAILTRMLEENAGQVVSGYILRKGQSWVFKPSEGGVFRIRDEPKIGVQYLLAADPALGIENTAYTKAGDYSAAVVVCRENNKIRQVAAIRVRQDVEAFTDLCVKLARYYNDAVICPENNSGTGRHMIRLLRKMGYGRIWRNREVRRHEIEIEDLLGWSTNVTTKQMMISDMQAALAHGAVDIADPLIIQELLDYSRKPAGSRERYGPASASGHDDMADAMMIAVVAFADNPPIGRPLEHISDYDSVLFAVERLSRLSY